MAYWALNFLFIIGLWSHSASAEYRVFVLRIVNPDSGEEKMVKTVFDHYQYPQYHYVPQNFQIQIWDSWKCWERTAPNRDYCPNPRDDMEDFYDPAA